MSAFCQCWEIMTFCLASGSDGESLNYLSSVVAFLCCRPSQVLGSPAIVGGVLFLAVTPIFPLRVPIVWVSVHHDNCRCSQRFIKENQINLVLIGQLSRKVAKSKRECFVESSLDITPCPPSSCALNFLTGSLMDLLLSSLTGRQIIGSCQPRWEDRRLTL